MCGLRELRFAVLQIRCGEDWEFELLDHILRNLIGTGLTWRQDQAAPSPCASAVGAVSGALLIERLLRKNEEAQTDTLPISTFCNRRPVDVGSPGQSLKIVSSAQSSRHKDA